jgi:hypothetical protein
MGLAGSARSVALAEALDTACQGLLLDAAGAAAVGADLARGALAAEALAPQHVDLLPFPTRQYTQNVFFSGVLNALTLLFVLAYIYPVSRLISAAVHEKETRMRESMLSMGLSEAALFSSHFGSLVLTNTLVAVGAAALLGASVYSRSNGGLLFLVFFAWGLALAAQTYLISVFFVRAKVASNLSAILFWLGYFPFIALTPQSGAGLRLAVSTLAPANLVNAWQIMASLEGMHGVALPRLRFSGVPRGRRLPRGGAAVLLLLLALRAAGVKKRLRRCWCPLRGGGLECGAGWWGRPPGQGQGRCWHWQPPWQPPAQRT